MRLSAVAYGALWRFHSQALPEDLAARCAQPQRAALASAPNQLTLPLPLLLPLVQHSVLATATAIDPEQLTRGRFPCTALQSTPHPSHALPWRSGMLDSEGKPWIKDYPYATDGLELWREMEASRQGDWRAGAAPGWYCRADRADRMPTPCCSSCPALRRSKHCPRSNA